MSAESLLALVERLDELGKAATPGPWECGPTPRYLGSSQFADGKSRHEDPVTLRAPTVHTEEIATTWTYLLPAMANAQLIAGMRNSLPALSAGVREMVRERARLQNERDALKLQAECHAMEARGQRSTVEEIYQLCTGATGEPGTWNGAEPVRRLVEELGRLREALDDLIGASHCYCQPQWAFGECAHCLARAALRAGPAGETKEA